MLSVLAQWQMWVMTLLPFGLTVFVVRVLRMKAHEEHIDMIHQASREVADMQSDRHLKDTAMLGGIGEMAKADAKERTVMCGISIPVGLVVSFLAFLLFPGLANAPLWVFIIAGAVGLLGVLIVKGG